MVAAMERYSQVLSIALMMSLPAGAGYWADSRFGTSPWMVVIGAALGLTCGMMQILRGMGRTKDKSKNSDPESDRTKP
jgi:F0F1-type ATP synthase assembly protein I